MARHTLDQQNLRVGSWHFFSPQALQEIPVCTKLKKILYVYIYFAAPVLVVAHGIFDLH